jgi:hypothetical protein
MDTTRLVSAFEGEQTPLVRTDFTDESAWQSVFAAVMAPVDFEGAVPEGYVPRVVSVDASEFDGVTGPRLGELFEPTEDAYGYVLLADRRSMDEAAAGGEVTLEYVDLSVVDAEDAELMDSFLGRTFRCVATEVASVESNLSISNMDFHEFADAVGSDGVFRGF